MNVRRNIFHRACARLLDAIASYLMDFVDPKYYGRLVEKMRKPLKVSEISWDPRFKIAAIRAMRTESKEKDTIQWINTFISEGDVLYDIGACIGNYSLYSAIKRKAKVVAFEPESANYFILNSNISLNNVSEQITAYCMAIGSSTLATTLNIQSDTENGWLLAGSSGNEVYNRDITNSKFRNDHSQGIISYSIDQLIYLFKFPVPNHVKIDIDGLEDDVIKGMTLLLADTTLMTLCVEINSNEQRNKLIPEIEGYGFKLTPMLNKIEQSVGNYFFTR